MRRVILAGFAVGAILLLARSADAQQAVRRLKFHFAGPQTGFQTPSGALSDGLKSGMWAPVLVRFVDDPEGDIRLPVAVDGSVSGELFVECADSDNVLSAYPQAFTFAANEPLQVLTYAKVSGWHPEMKISVKADGKTFPSNVKYCQTLNGGQQLYLLLGNTLPDFQEALAKLMGNQANNNMMNLPYNVAYESLAANLPSVWFGYNSVDLAILMGSNGKLIDSLTAERQSSPQLQALADWVRRGGRLVVSITPTNREKVYRLLSSPAWQPALPPVLSVDSKTFALNELDDLRNWSLGVRGMVEPFPRRQNKQGQAGERLGVLMEENPTVAVLCKEPDGKSGSAPLIVRFPHGTGSITLMAFDVNDSFIADWPGRFDFWQAVVGKLGQGETRGGADPLGRRNINRFNDFGQSMDVSSRLYDELDTKFDTTTIAFGWVLLFIILYIIVVGPLDYIVLKFVFKRLELTWITFPTVVITVSLLAYFTAYAVKGQDLKVNKVDLIDIDMRSALGNDLQPAGARAFGTTWFTILSPRIQNYTIGIEPVLQNWQVGVAAPAQPVEPTMSWFGRPDFFGMGGGRGQSPGLFSRTYNYEPLATGLHDVPIPVWTTKSFTASWEAPLDKSNLPFESKLTYESGTPNSLAGTLKSSLSFDLHGAGFVHRDKFYQLGDIPKGGTVEIKLNPQAGNLALASWINGQDGGVWGKGAVKDLTNTGNLFSPSLILRDMMFHDKAAAQFAFGNYTGRGLDWSWRLAPEFSDTQVQEIILVARVGRVKGPLEQLHADNDPTLPTHLWLGALPGTPVTGQKLARPEFQPRPSMQGTLNQDTYLRVILPVAPKRQP